MIERAYGKINLSLDINGVREDGYHTLNSIFLPIAFFDEIEINKADSMHYECDKRYLRFNETNTIVKAVNLMKDKFNINDNFNIKLKKHLPTQAGLAGGSSDGAAIIRAINKMYKLDLTDEVIKELCLSIGSDVLFTYYSKPAVVSGIGENIRFIEIKDDYYVLLVKPKYGVSTRECYNLMDINACIHPDINKLEEALVKGDDFIPYLGNSMEEAAIKLLPTIKNVKDSLIESGAPFALMSGSGSSVFTMSKDESLINEIYKKMKDKGYFVRYTKVVNK